MEDAFGKGYWLRVYWDSAGGEGFGFRVPLGPFESLQVTLKRTLFAYMGPWGYFSIVYL